MELLRASNSAAMASASTPCAFKRHACSAKSCIPIVALKESKGNVLEAKRLQAAGCDILRVTVPDKEAIKTVEALKENISIPLDRKKRIC